MLVANRAGKISINQLIKDFKALKQKELGFNELGDFVSSYRFDQLDYKGHLPLIDNQKDYARNILTMEPLELVLLHWPPGVESGIHHHQGFYGYVVILEGVGGDIVYKHEDDSVFEYKESFCLPGGIITEPDGVLHKIVNPSREETLVTLHIYYPPLESFDGMNIYDLNTGNIGVLSEQATTASWSDNPYQFKEIKEKAFRFNTYEELFPAATHKMIMVMPKPSKDNIHSIIADYYNEQAQGYDELDKTKPNRKAYTETIDQIIGEDLKNYSIDKILVLACGTGRRSINQMEISEQEYNITGVDISEKMIDIAEQKQEIDVIQSHWLGADLDSDTEFDAATFLYAFGHIVNAEERKQTLLKLNSHLKMGAPF
ncbi:MAG: methyltransferase domain-containing protein, partial [Bacteroidetes bacterium]|nr:methyltransferase domain-containing protein [Bacteroidota bacterium]